MAIFRFGQSKPQTQAPTVPELPEHLRKTKLGQTSGGLLQQGLAGQGSSALQSGFRRANTALLKGARDTRAQAGAALGAGNQLGQGTALRTNQAVEQNILSQLAGNVQNQAVEQGAEQERYLDRSLAETARGENLDESQRQFNLNSLSKQAEINPALHAKVTDTLLNDAGIPWSREDQAAANEFLAEVEKSPEAEVLKGLFNSVSEQTSPETTKEIMNLIMSEKQATTTDVDSLFSGSDFNLEQFLTAYLE